MNCRAWRHDSSSTSCPKTAAAKKVETFGFQHLDYEVSVVRADLATRFLWLYFGSTPTQDAIVPTGIITLLVVNPNRKNLLFVTIASWGPGGGCLRGLSIKNKNRTVGEWWTHVDSYLGGWSQDGGCFKWLVVPWLIVFCHLSIMGCWHPFQMTFSWLSNGCDPNYLLSGMILKASLRWKTLASLLNYKLGFAFVGWLFTDSTMGFITIN